MPPLIQLEQPYWREFQRQLKGLTGTDEEIKRVWAQILEPVRAEWARRLPGSLKKTAKVRRKARSGEIWAGYPRATADRPFLPWLEFGGTIRFRPGPRKFAEAVPFPWGIRMIPTSSGIHRSRNVDGRYRGPTVEHAPENLAEEFAFRTQLILNKYFH